MSKFALEVMAIGCVGGGVIWLIEGLTVGGFAIIAIIAVFAILSLGGK